MKDKTIIHSQYQIIQTLENFNEEKIYLVNNIVNNQKYLLQSLDLSLITPEEINHIREKIEFIKNIAKQSENNQRFPSLVDVLDEEKVIIIVYEKFEGNNLQETLNNRQLWTELEAVNYLYHLLESLDLIHRENLIHQIIKPQNLTITNQKIFINNYGKLSNLKSSLMETVTLEDKLYIAPEQIRGKIKISSDIYALGMVIISLVTGKNILSLEEDDTGKIIWSEGETLTANFIQIIDKMIAYQTQNRYNNCREVMADIAKFFPQSVSEKSLDYSTENIAHYTPTEIIIPTEKEEFSQEENHSKSSYLNPTEFVNSNNFHQKEKEIIVNDTELINGEDDIKSLLPLAEEYLSEESNSFSSRIESQNQQEISNNTTNNSSSFLPYSEHKFNLIRQIKTPKGILISFIICILIIFSFSWLKNYLYQKKVESLITEIQSYYEQENFDECIALINSNTVQSLPIANSLTDEFLGKCWLGLGEIQAVDGNFAEAINIAIQINRNSSDYERARQFIDDWSEQLFLEAKILCQTKSELSLVEEKLAPIPESSKWKKDALNLLDQCENNTNNNQVIPLCPGPLCPE
ncbi:serine/threonine protein kinase [Cyanobacterium sp. Dongsha4]|uniref:serine/threonine protein kinase n=1 Tax=Cyanobacterium sp. DS4 TaxID=2878255 RepID=UPI002E8171F4|nr:protein kinase [Cyanobacterium sp. Dongsha4]WVL01502.1 protein kinase [Cyanobacterium sp. Dongsha4]